MTFEKLHKRRWTASKIHAHIQCVIFAFTPLSRFFLDHNQMNCLNFHVSGEFPVRYVNKYILLILYIGYGKLVFHRWCCCVQWPPAILWPVDGVVTHRWSLVAHSRLHTASRSGPTARTSIISLQLDLTLTSSSASLVKVVMSRVISRQGVKVSCNISSSRPLI